MGLSRETFLEAHIVTPLYGILPFPDKHTWEMESRALLHEQKDRKLLYLSHKSAEAIDSDSSLVRRAKEHVQRIWIASNSRGVISSFDFLTTTSNNRHFALKFKKKIITIFHHVANKYDPIYHDERSFHNVARLCGCLGLFESGIDRFAFSWHY